ncbi:DUF3311 domain-containing protein [Nocardioides litoris]|uniref:DUF3311 domain-containing protein n=1 Tax=Nocardioides litoris TaxID=1926648 RepID=UPI00111D2AF1|nr:DUF3311 domain-containing protein [Nocardioides litoris]
MSLGKDTPARPQDAPPPTDRRKIVAACVCLAIPVVALLAVPTYARDEPELWGFPFFFWYQFIWVFLCSALTWTAYKLVLSARPPRGDRDGGGK